MKSRARNCLSLVLFVAALVAAACGSDQYPPQSAVDLTDVQPTPTPVAARPMIGYSVPDWWAEPTFGAASFATALCASGLGLTEIEYTLPDGTTNLAAAREFVSARRRCPIVTFINVVNWNNETAREQPDEWFEARVDEIVAEIGPDQVILGAVSEPDGSPKTYRWTELARSKWPGKFVTPGVRHELTLLAEGDFNDAHYCDLERLRADVAIPTPRRIFSTDCSPILNPGPEISSELAESAVTAGNGLNIYDWQAREPDISTIVAMGDAIRAAR